MVKLPLSVYALIAANLLPILMAGSGDWGMRQILPLYWFEAGICGLFAVPKIILTSGMRSNGEMPKQIRVLVAVIFALLFFHILKLSGEMFFQLLLWKVWGVTDFGAPGWGASSALLPALREVKWGVLCLFGSHALSFLLDFLPGGKHRRRTVSIYVAQPVAGVFLLMYMILPCAAITHIFKAPLLGMLVFALGKTLLDALLRLYFDNPDDYDRIVRGWAAAAGLSRGRKPERGR